MLENTVITKLEVKQFTSLDSFQYTRQKLKPSKMTKGNRLKFFIIFAAILIRIQGKSDDEDAGNNKKADCHLVINEINTNTPKVLKNQVFF